MQITPSLSSVVAAVTSPLPSSPVDSSPSDWCVCKAQAAAPAVYMFGDSLVDVGNNNYLPLSIAKADFPHNGVDFPAGNPIGRFSNGMNVADFLGSSVFV
ncbi:hypothetical protein L1887_20518 [Cichorium endivia]|nr:hypothetical protein L1887_20518 [Cichorium endivia]